MGRPPRATVVDPGEPGAFDRIKVERVRSGSAFHRKITVTGGPWGRGSVRVLFLTAEEETALYDALYSSLFGE